MYRLFVESLLFLSLMLWIGCQDSPQESIEKAPSGDKLFRLVPSTYSNLDFQNPIKQTRDHNHMIDVEFISGGGVAVGDINGDGLQDVFCTANQGPDKLYLNKGNLRFEDISSSAGILNDVTWSRGVTFVDIDRDGDQDIYVCKSIYLEDEFSANQLYINNGDLTFTERAEEFGIADHGFSVQASFADFNKDGYVDLYLVNQPPSIPGRGGQLNVSMNRNLLFSDKLYINNKKGGFEDMTKAYGVGNFAFGLNASVGDLNGDGWDDIYVTNDFDVPDHMYINQQNGSFKDVILEATVHISNFSMGSDIADIDNDGWMDIVVLDMMSEDHKRIKTHMGSMKPEEFDRIVQTGGHYQYMFNTLQRNNGNGSFSEIGLLSGVARTDWSWAPLFVDFDNDGYKDLFVTNGVKYNNRNSDLTSVYDRKLDSIKRAAPNGMRSNEQVDLSLFMELAPQDKLKNYLYRNNGDLTFTDVNHQWGMEALTLSNGAAYADLDNDGDLDVLVNNIDEELYLYENTLEDDHYIRVQLLDTKAYTNVYGSKVSLYKNGQLWQHDQMINTSGYQSKSEDVLHFGVGQLEVIDSVIVKWSDGSTSQLEMVAVDSLYQLEYQDSKKSIKHVSKSTSQMFQEITAAAGISELIHKENSYDDYAREILLPHKLSQLGPFVAVGDVNADGLEDFAIGGALGAPTQLYFQSAKGDFVMSLQSAFQADAAHEDMGMEFFDFDQDGDLDLYVVSGGNEHPEGDSKYQDRLFVNDGSGTFKKASNVLPQIHISGSRVKAFDFDKDGDLDLFVGGRMVPGQYPMPCNSILLQNENGTFKDVSKSRAPGFENLGMVTDVAVVDINQDGKDDLIVVGEWMPITIFTQDDAGVFQKEDYEDLKKLSGWYYSVKAEDMDNDGDLDIVAGNLGLNYKYKASHHDPFEIYSDDFDNNGSRDIVLSYNEDGALYPVRGKSCSTQQMPSLREKFPSYEEFGSADLIDVYGPSLENAYNLKAYTFATAVVENKGNGSFEAHPLPNLAQLSSVNCIEIIDANQDGVKDILIAGNMHGSEIETPRNDASIGLVLLGSKEGTYSPVPVNESGFFAKGDVKSMMPIIVKNQRAFLIGKNDDGAQLFQLNQ